MDEKTKFWIKGTLANDECSTNEELLEYFMKEGPLSYEEAAQWLALRSRYMLEICCDAEPGDEIDSEPYLPTFKGYTVDMRLKEFRKAIPHDTLEFIPFNTTKGYKLYEALKSFAKDVIALDSEE
jgi:hypothetical protein